MRSGNIITNNFWAKVISLVLAVITWFSVSDMMNSDSFMQKKNPVENILLRYKFIVKDVSVKPIFSGRSPEGYEVIFDDVTVNPSIISIFGPEDVLKDVETLFTERINLGEYTRTARLKLGLSSNVKAFRMKDKVVEVYLPVQTLGRSEEDR